MTLILLIKESSLVGFPSSALKVPAPRLEESALPAAYNPALMLNLALTATSVVNLFISEYARYALVELHKKLAMISRWTVWKM